MVGLPGEKVQIEDEFVIINGKKLDRPASLWFLTYYGFGRSRNGAVMECKDGYFVLGDDSRDSNDSRYEGPIEPRWIRGRAWLRVWPWERMGFVNP
jgi:signal peptidase I